MNFKSWGFIGGGRITRIFIEAFHNAGLLPENILVSDTNAEVLQNLKKRFPFIDTYPGDNIAPAKADIIFLSLHPPVIGEFLKSVKDEINPNAVLISLAPKFTIGKISEGLGGFNRIVRMIPNAPSIIGKGYNPVCFSEAIQGSEKNIFLKLFSALGECPEKKENKLEGYALLTAMGPTYFWFQLKELQDLAVSFGLEQDEIKCGISKMMNGTLETLLKSHLTPEEAIDLIPVKPLGDKEEEIKEMYRSALTQIYSRIKP